MRLSSKLLLLPVLLLLITPLASAYTFINLYIDETGKVTFSGETDKQLELPQGIELNNGVISGETQELTSKEGIMWTFSYELSGSDFYVVLPKGSVITSVTSSEIYIDDDQLSIYASNEIKVSYTVNEENSVLGIALIILIIIGLILSPFALLKERKRRLKKSKEEKPKEDKLEIIKQVLNDREKQIIDKLKETGKIKGSYLRRACDIPKPSFYRHILELEKKGLVKRSGDGRNKFIELVKKE